MKFYIETFGCKVNLYESNYIKESLLKEGYSNVSFMMDADIIIINTCTVTNTADSKCKKYVRRVRRENKDAILIVAGCSVQNNYEEYKNMNIDILIGTRYKSMIPSILKEYVNNHIKYDYYENKRQDEFEDMQISDFNHTRAFIKIQDGCDNFCSYCIIPFVRGKCRCKDFKEILKEANDLVNSGHKEIVLTGIHTGSYSYEGKNLVDLINELSKIDGLVRIRLSSVEITELNDEFMEMLKTNKKFCDHLHIPLQAGSNKVLKDMNRKYNMEYFFNKINEIRNIRKDISITTDIIVGFPEESDKEFLETYENAKKLQFSKIHVFPYSKRNGTKSSLMKDIDEGVKKKRVRQLLELSSMLEVEYENKFVGKKLDVLIEEVKDGISIGHTSNYLKVEIPKVYKKNDMISYVYKK